MKEITKSFTEPRREREARAQWEINKEETTAKRINNKDKNTKRQTDRQTETKKFKRKKLGEEEKSKGDRKKW